VLAHLWQDPTKADFLSDPGTGAFKQAFVAEVDKQKAANLKAKGIQKRFAVCNLGKPMSDLYRMLSMYSVHGGSPYQLITSQLAPTRVSCMLVNRTDPSEKDLTKDLEIFANSCEMLCVEITYVHGTFGKQYGLLPSKGGEGGFYLTKLLDRGSNSEMTNLVRATLHDLGWSEREVS
jgi:hypothetical protein